MKKVKLILIGEFDPSENKLKFAYANFLNCYNREGLKSLPTINKETKQAAAFMVPFKPRFKCEVIYNLKANQVSWSRITWLVKPEFHKYMKPKVENYSGGMPAIIFNEKFEDIASNVFSKSINKKLIDLKINLTRQGEIYEDLFEAIVFE
jgi:hypothetical protein